jgi:glycosyltransferase involved in cell wall biosynthesis
LILPVRVGYYVFAMDSSGLIAVSVIVPVFNGAQCLPRCLESLRRQTHPRVEIIVVDDGSTDGTPELVKPPIKLLRTGGRKGPGVARNMGARAATGEVLFFTDADVVAPPDWIEKALKVRAEKGVKCGGGGYAGPVKNIFVEQFAHEELVWRRRGHAGYVETLVSNNLWCDRDLFLAKGGFPEAYLAASSEDMEFSWAVSRDHTLWWDPDNGVFHDFPDTLRGYARQQIRFARDAVPMLLGNRALMRGRRTHHGKQLYVEVALTGLGIICPLLWLAVVGMNVGFLAAMRRRLGVGFAAKSLAMIFLRNFAIVWGVMAGLWKYRLSRPRGGTASAPS